MLGMIIAAIVIGIIGAVVGTMILLAIYRMVSGRGDTRTGTSDRTAV